MSPGWRAYEFLARLLSTGCSTALPCLPQGNLPAGLEDRASAPLIGACGGDRDLAHAAWATINGLIDLELADRLRPDADITAAYAAAARAYAGVRAELPEPWKVRKRLIVIA